MNSVLIHHIVRFVVFIFLQVIVLNRINLTFGSFNYAHLLIYSIPIILLPLNTPRPVTICLGFVVGLIIDLFFDSPGIHASALTATAFCRKYILQLLEPIEGYKVGSAINLTNMRMPWLLGYISILLFFHLCWYFSIEAFSFVYLKEILLRIISSFIVSYVLTILILIIYNPKY